MPADWSIYVQHFVAVISYHPNICHILRMLMPTNYEVKWMSCHFVIACEDDNWFGHDVNHSIGPVVLLASVILWCLTGTENIAGLLAQQMC